eukprot:TRINITY_DN41235_c0_g1_i1.p1 TRINITY_DN41235_c0_g1~~TRINITY_DN41235_c0_g1_i1.p1  ORF type:complete len:418 (+),score=79.84 TRINITY_DN41235_c0_g1_i1:86-1339(+)
MPAMASMYADGPALTENGLVLDLEDGHPIFFSFQADLSPSHEEKRKSKTLHAARCGLRLRTQAAKHAAKVDQGEVCSIDMDGSLHGAFCPVKDNWPGLTAEQRKKYHRRFQNRRRRAAAAMPSSVICTGSDGSVVWYKAFAMATELGIDREGVVQSIEDLAVPDGFLGADTDRLRRLFRKKQEVMRRHDADILTDLACAQPNGSVRWILQHDKPDEVQDAIIANLGIMKPPACRIDTEGHVHDVLTPPISPALTSKLAERLKLFHRKKHQRDQQSAGPWQISIDTEGDVHWSLEGADVGCSPTKCDSGYATPSTMDLSHGVPFERTCSIDSEGIVHLTRSSSGGHDLLASPLRGPSTPSADRLKKFHRKRVSRGSSMHSSPDGPTMVVSMDDHGRVQGWQEVWEEPLIVPVFDLDSC